MELVHHNVFERYIESSDYVSGERFEYFGCQAVWVYTDTRTSKVVGISNGEHFCIADRDWLYEAIQEEGIYC